MSGTVEEQAADQPAPIPNYSATPKTETINGEVEKLMVVKYGHNAADPSLPEHVLDIRKIGMDDQFDLAEIASSLVDNDVWLSLAVVAMSVQKIDGVPIPRGNLTKAALRSTLKKIGALGVRAVRRAMVELSGAVDGNAASQDKAAAGN